MELHFSPSRQVSATFPLTHGSAGPASQIISPPNPGKPLAVNLGGDHASSNNRDPILPQRSHHARNDADGHANSTDAPKVKHNHRHLVFDGTPLDPVRLRTRQKHKHSKSRDGRFPRIMYPIASSSGAKGLLPAWPIGREKENDTDDGLLRPMTRETTRSRWGSESTVGFGTGSRKGSFLDEIDSGNKLGLIRPRDVRSAEDLEQVKDRRKQGEEFLRSALSFIGTLATDITRRLDYTYYNLLEKAAALHTTVSSFQELADSTSTLFTDFERETTSLGQDIRKQIRELREFHPQIQKIESFEERMRVGRARATALSDRLESMRSEIDHWEKREVEFQTRINRRLRLFWAVIIAGILTILVAFIVQNWSSQLESRMTVEAVSLGNDSTSTESRDTENWGHISSSDQLKKEKPLSSFPEHTTHNLRFGSAHTSASTELAAEPTPTEQDPLRLLDEL